jgi:hypothetical protein
LTNAGKTYTVIGDPTNPGILPLTLKYLYEAVNLESTLKNESTAEIYCNYIEIYNEEVFDMLSTEGKRNKCKKKVNIKERDKIFYVQSNCF